MSDHLARAELLYDQDRYEQAAVEFHQHLLSDPNDSFAHAMMAICLAHMGRYNDALTHARQGISLGPDMPYTHAALAQVEMKRARYDAAAAAMNEAIELMPSLASYHGLMAAIRANQKRWKDVLAAANQGLEYDPEEPTCLNLRAMALRQLGQNQAAAETIRDALATDPNNAFTHANEGWGLLEAGDSTRALEHLREALRLEPDLEYARLGIVETLKAQNAFYRHLLQYLFWIGRKPPAAQWALAFAIVLAIYVAPLGGPLVNWLVNTAILFNGMTMLFAQPLCNCFLLLHPLGWYALSQDQKSQGVMTALLAVGILTLFVWKNFESGYTWVDDAFVVCAIASIPALSIHDCQHGWPRWSAIGLLFLTPLIFFSPLLVLLAAPALSGWLPYRGPSNFIFIVVLAIALYLVCQVLENVELVESDSTAGI